MSAKAVDLDGIVRVCAYSFNLVLVIESKFSQLSNEFQFPVASFHHAGETYLVPDLLNKTWVCLSSSLFAFLTGRRGSIHRGVRRQLLFSRVTSSKAIFQP